MAASWRWWCLGLMAACASPAPGGGDPGGSFIGSDAFGAIKADAKSTADTKSGTDAAGIDSSDTGAIPDVDGQTSGTCTDGEFQCFNAKIVKHCVAGNWVADPCNDDEACQNGACVKLASCTPGAKKCDGYQFKLECAADGKSWQQTKCKPPQLCVAGECAQTVCVPNVSECVAGTTGDLHTCLPDGTGWGPTTTCKGSTCLGGKCLSLCESNLKVANNVGCEYWSVDLDSFKDTFSAALNPKGLTPDMIPHSIVIANPGTFDAKITFSIGASCPDGTACTPDNACKGGKVCDKPGAVYELGFTDTMVKAGQTREFKMPVMNSEGNTLTQKGVHIKSDQPILAWQFNPFNSENAASNDGTLLLPQHMLGQKYYVVSGGMSGVPAMGFPAQHGYFTVVAASPGFTKVTITPSGDVDGDALYGIPPLKKGVPWTTTLLQHGALTLQAKEAQLSFSPKTVDLTGSLVESDKPVAVFGGHEELVLDYLENTTPESGYDSCCAEHVEEQLLPVDNWGTDVLCVKTKPRGAEPDFWRVVAGEDNVKITIGGTDYDYTIDAKDTLATVVQKLVDKINKAPASLISHYHNNFMS